MILINLKQLRLKNHIGFQKIEQGKFLQKLISLNPMKAEI